MNFTNTSITNCLIVFVLPAVAYEVVPNAPINSTAILFDIPPDADPGLVHNNSMSGKLKFEFDHIFEQVFNLSYHQSYFFCMKTVCIIALLIYILPTEHNTGRSVQFSCKGADNGCD